jgi:hypothetical protein
MRKTKIPGLYRTPASRVYPDGGWLVRYRDSHNGTRMKTFRTKQEALDFKAAVQTDKRRGDFIDPRSARVTLSEVAERWFASREARLTPATLAGYHSALKTHLLPAFGNRAVSKITASDIELLLSEAEISPKTQQNLLRVLSPILNLAVRDGCLRTNPCALVEVARQRKAEPKFLAAAQVRELAEAVFALR